MVQLSICKCNFFLKIIQKNPFHLTQQLSHVSLVSSEWKKKTVVKNVEWCFFFFVFEYHISQGKCRICDLQVLKDIWRHFTTDVSYFVPYAETKNNEDEWKVCMKWIQFRSWFRPSGTKVSSFIIQKFSRCFSLSFNVSVDVVRMFLSCSMIMIFPWLLKSWSCLLKCLQAGIALGFLTSFLWLLSLMLNGVSDWPMYWMLQM